MMIVHKGDAIWDNEFALLGVDDVTGASLWLEYENGEMTGRAKYVNPIDPTLEANKVARDEMASQSKRGEWSKIGSIPVNLRDSFGLGTAIKNHDRKWIQKFFNDSDYSGFKVAKGRV